MSTTPENLYRFPVQGYPYDSLWYDGNTANPPWYPVPQSGVKVAQPNPKPKPPADEGSGKGGGEGTGTIELKVPFCCDAAVSKVTKKLKELEGVGSVSCDMANNKVTVKGPVKKEKVLKQLKTIKHLQRADFWETKKAKN